jgi:putative membrane-bound dehydrogenase-like protein
MFAAFDDRGRLFVAESSGLDLYAELLALTRKCRVRMLEDRDGDGKFETANVFADKLVYPMGLAWRDGKLYVADPPDLVTYEDLDGDGTAENRKVILSRFGHRDNGSLHGLVFGPDGWLYMTMGAPDGYKLKRRDGSFLEGNSGALIRCRPDGSDPEVVCRGFVNLVEVAFTSRGERIGTDNWFQHPQDGKRDALVHLLDGGLYPYEPDTGTRFPITGEPLGPVALFPAVALSGLCTYRSAVFPELMHGNLFSAQHNSRKIGRHVLVPAGSTFRAESFDFVTTDDPDFHPSDVLEAADGSLIVIDTGAWYVQHCPTGRIRAAQSVGGIYRVRSKSATPMQDPWGNAIDWQRASVDDLIKLLSDPRPAVRDRAERALAAIGKEAIPQLKKFLDTKAPVMVRQHAIWALAAIPEHEALLPLCVTLVDSDAGVVVPAARSLGMYGKGVGRGTLATLLKHESPAVRIAAAEALARCGTPTSLPALWEALAKGPDAFLEHEIVHAIHHLADAAALESRLDDSNPRITRAAMLLLDQSPRPAGLLKPDVVFQSVQSSDAGLRRTSMDLLARHPEWAERASDLLRRWLQDKDITEEQRTGLRGLVFAFQAQPAIQQLAAGAIINRDVKAAKAQRTLLLAALAESTLSELPQAWTSAVATALDDVDAEVRLAAVRTAAVWQIAALDERVARLAESDATPDIRREALRAVIRRRPKLTPAAFRFLAGELRGADHPIARFAAAEVFRDSNLTPQQLREVLEIAETDAIVPPSVLLPMIRRSATRDTAPLILTYIATSLDRGWRPGEAELNDSLKVIPNPDDANIDRLRESHRKNIAGQQARLASFEQLLTGGDADRGRQVFLGKKAGCSACHRITGEGGQVGPDLTKLGAIRSGRDMLESIVLPSSTIAQGYDAYLVTTGDGRAITGVIKRQTNDILVLSDSSGAELRLPKSQIEDLQRAATSIMPDGLASTLTREELRDLLAFLQSLK